MFRVNWHVVGVAALYGFGDAVVTALTAWLLAPEAFNLGSDAYRMLALAGIKGLIGAWTAARTYLKPPPPSALGGDVAAD